MKVITSNAVYVQKNDIRYLILSDLLVPETVCSKIIEGDKTNTNDDNRYDFVKFEDEKDIEYFKNLDYIVDYDEVKDLSENELIKIGKNICNERATIAKAFNEMSKEEQEQNMSMHSKCEALSFKVISIRDILWFKEDNTFDKLSKAIEHLDEDNKSIKKKISKIYKRKFRKR